MKEIRLHGRGGQGVVSSAELIVHAAIENGKFASCFPFFGFEKKGGPVAAFVRISEEKIRPKCEVYTPDCIIVVDPTIANSVNVFDGLKPGGLAFLNCEAPSAIGFPPGLKEYGWLDATAISMEIFGRALPNTVMLGAFAAVSSWVDTDTLSRLATELWGPKNADAVRLGSESVNLVKL